MRSKPMRWWGSIVVSSLVVIAATALTSPGQEPSAKRRELTAIQDRVRSLVKDLNSTDPVVQRKAEADRKKAVSDFEDWAKKFNVDVTKHEEPAVRKSSRGCPFYSIKTTEIDGVIETSYCINFGKNSRGNCVDLCISITE